VIVVVGRPWLSADGKAAGGAGLVALAAARAGGRVELVGSVGNDLDGDAVITELGRAGIGHAAILRDPAGVTRSGGADGNLAGDPESGPPLPRLEAADLDLGLRYLAECQVLVVAEPLPSDVVNVAADAATYHAAALVVLAEPSTAPSDLPDNATVLELPDDDDGAFAELVGRYAVKLDAGQPPSDAWREATEESGWEKSAE
jgi:sugar/nucleoside kinase (ribokinase family)